MDRLIGKLYWCIGWCFGVMSAIRIVKTFGYIEDKQEFAYRLAADVWLHHRVLFQKLGYSYMDLIQEVVAAAK